MKNTPPSHRKELKYYGIHATMALFQKRPQDIIRVYVEVSNIPTAKPLLKWCAKEKIAYHIVSDEELEKITESTHHEGISILAKEKQETSLEAFFSALKRHRSPLCILYLDGVQNPHNLGAIIRTAAHFHIPYILGKSGFLPKLSPSTCRIAQGGAECVELLSLQNPVKILSELKQLGFSPVGTTAHQGTSLFSFSYTPRTLLVMGSESEGISQELDKLLSARIEIPGTRAVESLNVSVAAAVCIAEFCRQHPTLT